MTRSVAARVATLERAHGPRAPWCECPGKVTLFWGEPAAQREVCPRCGRPIRVLTWYDVCGGEEADDDA